MIQTMDYCPQCERQAFHLVEYETDPLYPEDSVYDCEMLVCDHCGHEEVLEYDEADMSYATEEY